MRAGLAHVRRRMRNARSQPLEKLNALFEEANGWCAEWGLSRLMRDVSIEFSDEIGQALGRCDVRRMSITLNGVLLRPENERLLAETLCHELAHVIAALRYGCGIEEHGSEWAEYMTKAGFAPRPVIAASLVAGLGENLGSWIGLRKP